jgi:hypothetical protein
LGHTRGVIRSGLRSLGVGALLVAISACSSGGTRVTLPATSIAPVVLTPTTAAMPTTVRKSAAPSACPRVLPASPTSRGVGRPDISLVPIAAISVEVCAFVGSSAPKTRGGDVVFDGVDADVFGNDAGSLAGIDPVSGPRCEPGATASVLVLVSDGVSLEQLLVSRAGCGGVSNGFLSAPATSMWTAELDRAVELADLCSRRFGVAASCIAVDS